MYCVHTIIRRRYFRYGYTRLYMTCVYICNNTFIHFCYLFVLVMPQVSKTYYTVKDVDVKISEITDGIYRIAGFVDTYGITFNQFLIDDERPVLIHTGPIGMYQKIEEKVREGGRRRRKRKVVKALG